MIRFRLHIPGIAYSPGQESEDINGFRFGIREVTPHSFVTGVLNDLVRGQEVWLPDPDPHRECSRVVRRSDSGYETRVVCHGFNDPWRAVSRQDAEQWLAPAAEWLLATRRAEGWIHWQFDAEAVAAASSSSPSYRSLRADRYEAERAQLLSMLDSDMWQGWANDPEVIITLELSHGIRALLGGDLSIARRYFRRGMTVCERSDRELPCRPPPDDMEPALAYAFPLNRAQRTRCRVHLRGFLEAPDAHESAVRELHAAAEDLVAYEAYDQRGSWSEIGQARTLDAVRFMLLSGDVAAAARILKTRRKFRHHAEEHAILLDLVKGDRSAHVRERLVAFFDRIRNPEAKLEAHRDVDLVPIETALLLDRLFDHPDGRLHWLRAAARTGY
ncbi:MAG: hypothetical protein BroJett006_28520 [Betaproteobacteria bacterium]|nr:MAG: hypothetical protein BroJett006_28520 [Betaproteobacteria bacterium]